MAGISFGLGPQDWLKMANPLKTVPPITQTGTTAPKTLAGSTTNATTAAPSPIGGTQGWAATQNNAIPAPGGASQGAGTWGNILPAQPAVPQAPPTPQPMIGGSVAPAPATTAPAPLGKVSANSTTVELKPNTITGQETVNTAPRQAPGMTFEPPPQENITMAAPAPVEQTTANVQEAMPTQPITYTETPKPQDVAVSTPTPQTMVDGGKGVVDAQGNTVPVSQAPLPPAATVTAPEKTGPSLDDNMALYEKTAQDWMNGVVDEKVFRTTANRAILQMGLNNTAEMDALKMRINGDPSLAGQGAGSALLSMMSSNQNFNADQLFGQLAESAQQKILDMQKYGLEQGVRINGQRRDNAFRNISALQDAGDFTGAAKALAKLVDFPGVSIDPNQFTASRARQSEDIQNLMTAGNYQGAAEKLSKMTGIRVDAAAMQARDPFVWEQAARQIRAGDYDGAAKTYAANGLTITADDLRARDPYMQETWTNTLDGIKAIAATNPAMAEAELAILMKNPSAAKYLGFTSTMNPKDLIASIVSGQYAQDQAKISTLNTEINRQAKSNVSFSTALENYRQQGPVQWEGLTNTGKRSAETDLTKFNEARRAMGMGEVRDDGQGNIVDASGTALLDDDFAETAAAMDYMSRKTQLAAQPWEAVYQQMISGPLKDKILSIPGGDQKVREALQIMWLGGGYKRNAETGLMEPDFTNGMPWENPNSSYLYHDWPLATFGTDGKHVGTYDLGGSAYGEKLPDGQVIQKLPEDEHLDNLYAKYRYAGGKLSATEWYFASAGGAMPADPTRVPTEVAPKVEIHTQVGTTNTTIKDNPTASFTTDKAPEILLEAASDLGNFANAEALAVWKRNQVKAGNTDLAVKIDDAGNTANVVGTFDTGQARNGTTIELNKDGVTVLYDPGHQVWLPKTPEVKTVGTEGASGPVTTFLTFGVSNLVERKDVTVTTYPEFKTFQEALDYQKKVSGT